MSDDESIPVEGVQEVEPGSGPGHEAGVGEDGVAVDLGRALPAWRPLGAWVLLLAVTVALDGLVGGLAAVVVGAVLLARLPARIVGALGSVALLAVPIVVVILGIPTAEEVSPAFVTRSLVPHHLTFVGLVWAGSWAVLDLLPHLVATPEPVALEAGGAGDGSSSTAERIAAAVVVLVVAVGAVLACAAVLQA